MISVDRKDQPRFRRGLAASSTSTPVPRTSGNHVHESVPLSITNQMPSSSLPAPSLAKTGDRLKGKAEPESEPQSTVSSEPNAEGASETRPESETKFEPSSEAEGSNTSPKSEPDTAPEAESWPEPGPQWKEAFETWKWAWHFHVYCFATLFLLIGFYSGYYVVVNLYDGVHGKYLSVSLNAMVLLFGTSRAFVLYLDPYHQGQLIDALLFMRMMWSIGGPCLTAADSLIILALVETAKISIGPPRFQKLSVISSIVTFHFAFVLTTDVVVSAYMEAKAMILFCQLFFTVWGVVLGLGYFALAHKLDKKLFSHKLVKERQDKMYIYLVYASGVANMAIVGIMFYTAVGPFGIYADLKFIDAWHWYTLQTMFRISEIITCILVFTVSAKRTRVQRAVDQLTSASSQATESSDDSSVVGKLRGLWSRLRCKKSVTPDDTIDEKEQEMLQAAWLGKQSSAFVMNLPEDDATLSNQVIPSRGRRQSLFSAIQDASVASTLNDNVISTGRTRRQNVFPVEHAQDASAPPSTSAGGGGRRNRRQSLFSAMQEASIASTLNENIITTGRSRRERSSTLQERDLSNSLCKKATKDLSPKEEDVINSTSVQSQKPRGRRRSLFTALQENKEQKVRSHTLIEEDCEEEECESKNDKRPPLKRNSSLRMVLKRISDLLQSQSKVSPENSEIKGEEEEKDVKVEEESPSVSTISI